MIISVLTHRTGHKYLWGGEDPCSVSHPRSGSPQAWYLAGFGYKQESQHVRGQTSSQPLVQDEGRVVAPGVVAAQVEVAAA